MSARPPLQEILVLTRLGAVAVEATLGHFGVIRARYRLKDTLASIAMRAGNVATNLALAGLVFAGYSVAYDHRLFTFSPTSPVAWVVLFVLDDFTYYWFHRVSHECRFWWAAHVNHHSSQEYNLSTAVRQPWTGLLAGTWLPWIPIALLGFPPAMMLTMQGLNLFYQFWVHHAANPRYLDRNYAGVLMIWDRMFGSFEAERDDEPPRYGIIHNIATFNPLRIAFHEWAALTRDLWAASSVREAAGVAFGPPGWRADGSGPTARNVRAAWEAAP
jgi:sterol desaturase/sphingolipid hydroxylase (fatty acid hydroxylase superfamily)